MWFVVLFIKTNLLYYSLKCVYFTVLDKCIYVFIKISFYKYNFIRILYHTLHIKSTHNSDKILHRIIVKITYRFSILLVNSNYRIVNTSKLISIIFFIFVYNIVCLQLTHYIFSIIIN